MFSTCVPRGIAAKLVYRTVGGKVETSLYCSTATPAAPAAEAASVIPLRTMGMFWDRVVQNFEEIFALMLCADWHTRNLQICDSGTPPCICGFAICGLQKRCLPTSGSYSTAQYARTFNSTLTPKSLNVIKIQENKQAQKTNIWAVNFNSDSYFLVLLDFWK